MTLGHSKTGASEKGRFPRRLSRATIPNQGLHWTQRLVSLFFCGLYVHLIREYANISLILDRFECVMSFGCNQRAALHLLRCSNYAQPSPLTMQPRARANMSWGDTWLLIGILSPLLLPATVACVFVLFYITIELDRWLRKASGGSEDPSAHPPAPAISAPSNLEPMELGRSESAPVFVLQEGAPENNLVSRLRFHSQQEAF